MLTSLQLSSVCAHILRGVREGQQHLGHAIPEMLPRQRSFRLGTQLAAGFTDVKQLCLQPQTCSCKLGIAYGDHSLNTPQIL